MARRAFRVLAIDGGGIRGIIPARVLVEIERLTNRRIAELFDLIVGTSTGGILALGLSKQDAAGRPAHTAETLLDLYMTRGREIFPGGGPPTLEQRIFGLRGFGGWRNPWRVMKESGQAMGAPFGGNPLYAGNARYFPDGLEKVLKECLGDAQLGDALAEVIVTGYDMKTGTPVLFRSDEARRDPTRNPLMRALARATSAGPTYFPPLQLDWGGEKRIMIDGGVFANNPAMIGYVEGLLLARGGGDVHTDVLVVSVGTGTPERRSREQITLETVMSEKWLSVARGILDVVFGGTSDNQHDLLDRLMRRADAERLYWRFQTILKGASPNLDDTSAGNLEALRLLGDELVRVRRADLDMLAERLSAG